MISTQHPQACVSCVVRGLLNYEKHGVNTDVRRDEHLYSHWIPAELGVARILINLIITQSQMSEK